MHDLEFKRASLRLFTSSAQTPHRECLRGLAPAYDAYYWLYSLMCRFDGFEHLLRLAFCYGVGSFAVHPCRLAVLFKHMWSSLKTYLCFEVLARSLLTVLRKA